MDLLQPIKSALKMIAQKASMKFALNAKIILSLKLNSIPINLEVMRVLSPHFAVPICLEVNATRNAQQD